MRLGQTSAIYFISKLLAAALGFIATIYFTRTLGDEIYGLYALTLALVSWLGIVKSLGFGSAIVKRMSEGEEPDEYLAAGTVIKVTLTIVIALAVLAFQDQVNAYVGQPVAELVILLLIASIISGIVSTALKGTHRVHIYAPLTTAREAAMTICMIVLVYLGWELTGMLLGHALGTIFIALVGLSIVRPRLVVPKQRHIIRLFDFAKYSWLSKMEKKSINEMDILVLGVFVSAGLTGVYAVAYSLSKFLEMFGSAISKTLFPEISKLSTETDIQMTRKLTTDALTYAGLFLIPGIIGAAVLADRLMLIYGPEFEVGEQVLLLLMVGVLTYTYSRQLLTTLNAIDRPDLAFRANGVVVIANIVLNVTLIYSIGWVGAAIATTTSAAIGFVLSLYYVRTQIELTLPYNEVALQWFAALCMGIVVYIARHLGEANLGWVDAYNAVFVVGLVGLGATVYFTLLLGISSTFRTTVATNLPFDMPLFGR